MIRIIYQVTTKYLQRFSSVPTYTLGRWKIHENQEDVWKKIDMTTEDHCGCDEMREKYVRSLEDIEDLIEKVQPQDKKD